MQASIRRKTHFNAAHRVFNPAWSDEKNLDVFGACSYPHFHGHNYVLEVLITGPINPDTGYVIDFKDLDALIQKHVLELLDHKNINLDIPAFQARIASTENLTHFIYEQLRAPLPKEYHLQIILHETERNAVIYPPLMS